MGFGTRDSGSASQLQNKPNTSSTTSNRVQKHSPKQAPAPIVRLPGHLKGPPPRSAPLSKLNPTPSRRDHFDPWPQPGARSQGSGDIRILRLPRQEVRDQLRPRRRDDGDARDATRDELRQDLLHVASAQVALGLQELRDITWGTHDKQWKEMDRRTQRERERESDSMISMCNKGRQHLQCTAHSKQIRVWKPFKLVHETRCLICS